MSDNNNGVTRQVYIKKHTEGAVLIALNSKDSQVSFTLKNPRTSNYMKLSLLETSVMDLPINIRERPHLSLLGIKLLEFRLIDLSYYIPESYYQSRPDYIRKYKDNSYFCVEIKLQNDWFFFVCKKIYLDLEDITPPENEQQYQYKLN